MSASDNQKRRFGLLIVLLCPILAFLTIPRYKDMSVRKRAHRLTDAVNWTPLQMAGVIPYQWMPDGRVIADQQGAPIVVDTLTGTARPLTSVRKALAAHPELGALATRGPHDWTISPDGVWMLTRAITRRGNPPYGQYFTLIAPGRWVAVKLDGSAVITYPAQFMQETQAVWTPGQPEWIAVTPTPGVPIATHFPLAAHGTPKTVVLRSHASFEDPAAVLGTVGPNRIMVAAWYREAHVEILDTGSSGGTLERYQISLPPGAQAIEMEVSPKGDRIAWLLDFASFSPIAPLRRFLPFLHPSTGQTQGEIWVSDIHGDDMRPLITGGSDGNHSDAPHFLRWTPDQSKISFVYQNSLYTVPAT